MLLQSPFPYYWLLLQSLFFTIECCYSHLFLCYWILLQSLISLLSNVITNLHDLLFLLHILSREPQLHRLGHRKNSRRADLFSLILPWSRLSQLPDCNPFTPRAHQLPSVPRVFLTAVSLTIVHRVFNVTILTGILYLTSTSENSSFYETDLHTIDSALLRPAYPPSMKVDCQTVKRNLFSSSKSDLSDYCSAAGPLVAGPGGWLGLNVDSGRCCQSPPLASNGEHPTTGAGRNPHF